MPSHYLSKLVLTVNVAILPGDENRHLVSYLCTLIYMMGVEWGREGLARPVLLPIIKPAQWPNLMFFPKVEKFQ